MQFFPVPLFVHIQLRQRFEGFGTLVALVGPRRRVNKLAMFGESEKRRERCIGKIALRVTT